MGIDKTPTEGIGWADGKRDWHNDQGAPEGGPHAPGARGPAQGPWREVREVQRGRGRRLPQARQQLPSRHLVPEALPDQGVRANKGKYGSLDFAALIALSSVDRELRTAFREIAIDIEHFARVELLEKCVEQGEDCYGIVEDYFAQLRRRTGNDRALESIKDRSSTGDRPDPYSGDLIAHYVNDLGGLSVWALLEVVEFGRFADFWLFCARRWKDQEMLGQHYVLRSVKGLRNACCHNNCIVHAFSREAESAGYTVREPLASSLKENGLKNTKSRKAKLNNLRIAQIAAALYAANRYCDRDATRARHAALMGRLRSMVDATRPMFPDDGSLGAYFDFIFKMVDVWLPTRA